MLCTKLKSGVGWKRSRTTKVSQGAPILPSLFSLLAFNDYLLLVESDKKIKDVQQVKSEKELKRFISDCNSMSIFCRNFKRYGNCKQCIAMKDFCLRHTSCRILIFLLQFLSFMQKYYKLIWWKILRNSTKWPIHFFGIRL